MTPPEPRFLVPASVPEAVELMAEKGSVAVAGGTWLAPLLKGRTIEPERLVYLGRIAQLRTEQVQRDVLTLGAVLTLHQLASSGLVTAYAPLLARTAASIASPRVRSVATVGGSVAIGDGRHDLPVVLLALGATVRLRGPAGARSVPLEHLHDGSADALAADEIVTGVEVTPESGRRVVYLRFAPGSVQDYLTVGVAAAVSRRADGLVTSARIALAGVAAGAVVPAACAEQLVGRFLDPDAIGAAAEAAAQAVSPGSDRLGTADYKRAMTRVWTRRALEALT